MTIAAMHASHRHALLPVTVTAIFALAVGSGCFLDDVACDADVLQTVPSPSGKYNAVIARMRCGVTTPFNYSLHIVEPDEHDFVSRVSILSIKDTNPWLDTSVVEVARHQEITRVDLLWTSSETLEVSLDPRATVIHQKGKPPDGIEWRMIRRQVQTEAPGSR